MYQEIKRLADEALALQNKIQMENALRNISATCQQLADSELLRSAPAGFKRLTAEQNAQDVADSVALAEKYEHVVYGTAQSYDSEAEMIADIQGSPSPVFPLPAEKAPLPCPPIDPAGPQMAYCAAPAPAKKGAKK